MECVRAARPPATERVRRWSATRPTLVTSLLVSVNLALYVWGLVLMGSGLFSTSVGPLQRDLALQGFAVSELHEWYRIITSGFVHYGLIHVGFNMVILWRLGTMLEPALGSIRFTLTYFACLIGGSAGALLLEPNALTAGASGAVFGLMGVAVVGLRQRRVPVMQTDIGALLAMNILITFVIPNVAIGGHLGGLVTGLALGTVLLRPRRGRPPWWEVLVPIGAGAALFVVALVAAGNWG
jgi:membrane associated rhomboid family serine protease